MMRRGTIPVLVVCALLWAPPAAGQVQPTETQKELNREAYRLMAHGDHDAAIETYLQSLEVGDLNVTWLNLGRAYQQFGQCQKAYDAYEKVPNAPQVAKPTPQVVANTLERFRAELEVQCPTQIVIRCRIPTEADDDSIVITLGGERQRRCGDSIEVEPGTHVVTASGERIGRLRRSVLVERGQSVELKFELDAEEAAPATTEDVSYGTQPARTASDEIERISGEMPLHARVEWDAIAMLGVGSFISLSGLVFDGLVPGWPAYANDYRLQAGDFIPVVFYSVGFTLVTLAIVDILDGPEDRK